MLAKLILCAMFIGTAAGVTCYHCYKSNCRYNFEKDDDVKLSSIRKCGQGTDRCFIYFLRDNYRVNKGQGSAGDRSIMRVCGLNNWAGFMSHCDNATQSTRSCYCTSDYCNGPHPKLFDHTEDSFSDDFINSTDSTTYNETALNTTTSTSKTLLDPQTEYKEGSHLPIMLTLFKSFYSKTVVLFKSLW